MDPLSIIASVAGITTAAAGVVKTLGPYVTASRDAPRIASQLLADANATRTILSGVEGLIRNVSVEPIRYASLIQIDQLVAVLTDGVLVFSELEGLLSTLLPPKSPGPGSVSWRSIQWVWKKGDLEAICTRLQAFKISISCILNILQRCVLSATRPLGAHCG